MLFTIQKNALRISWNLNKIILLFFMINLFSASLFLLPYLKAFKKFFSHRLASEILAQENLYTYYSEFYHYSKPISETITNLLSFGSMILYLLSFLLSGGIVYLLIHGGIIDLQTFLINAAKFALRMLRLIPVAITILVLIIIMTLVVYLPFSYFLPSPFIENIYFYYYAFGCLLIVLTLILGNLIIDITRIDIVKSDSASVLTSLKFSFILFLRNPVRIYFSYFSLFLIHFILIVIYFYIQRIIPDTTDFGLVLSFLFLQLFVYIQIWLKFAKIGVLTYFAGD